MDVAMNGGNLEKVSEYFKVISKCLLNEYEYRKKYGAIGVGLIILPEDLITKS